MKSTTSRWSSRVCSWALLWALCARPAQVRAETTAEGSEGPGLEVSAGVTLVALAGLGGEGAHAHYGSGVFIEVAVLPGWLTIELNLQQLFSEHSVALPIELLFKKPFRPSSWFRPYLGLGPTLVPAFLHDELGARYGGGGASVVGADLRFAPHLALTVEGNYNLLYEDRSSGGELVHELGGKLGLSIDY